MPFDLLLSDGDVTIDSFDLQLNTPGAQAVAQRIAITLKTFQGEYFLDTTFGAPWYQTVLRKGVSKNLVDSELKAVILAVEDVVQMVSYESTFNNSQRSLAVNFKVRVNEGGTVSISVLPDGTIRITTSDDYRITSSGDYRISA